MEPLLTFDDDAFHYQYPPALPGKHISHEIVEISSDEDNDPGNGQPESSKSAAKRVVDFWDEDGDIFFERRDLENIPHPTGTKRPRLGGDATADITAVRPSVPQNYPTDTQLLYSSQFDDPLEWVGEDLVQRRSDVLGGRPQDAATPPLAPGHNVTGSLTTSDIRFMKDSDQKSQPSRQQEQQTEVAPYFFDRKLRIAMYRGPGYEKFPVVLEDKPEHVEVCDEWDKKYLMNQFLGDHQQHSQSQVTKPDEANTADLECLQAVLEVLPDVQHSFVLTKIQEHTEVINNCGGDDFHIRPSAADVTAMILEHSDYPKQEKVDTADGTELDGTGVTIKWQKSDATNKSYQKDAVCLLAGQFQHVPTFFIHRIVQEKKTLFDSYRHISDLELNYWNTPLHDRPYRRSQEPRLTLEKKYNTKEESRSTEQWRNLINEMQAARQQMERERIRAARIHEQEAREIANLQDHIATGSIVECQCCFDDEVPINRAVSCDGEHLHWFCFSCVKSLADNQVGLLKHEMSCMDGSGCQASLSSDGVAQAVPTKTYDKLAFLKQQYEIAAAGIEGLEECPFCDFKAICDPIEEESMFRCQNPDCRRVTCRRCHEDGHGSKSCEQARKDKGLSARHQIEEARSEAMIRTCPQCKVKIIKADGCNKMTCSNCRCSMCYVCKADITSTRKPQGYEHFNGAGATCALYDKGYNRHEREADEAEKEAIRKVRAENAELDENELQIETGDEMKRARKDQQKDHRGPRGVVYHDNHPVALEHIMGMQPVRPMTMIPHVANQYEHTLPRGRAVQERLERGRLLRQRLGEYYGNGPHRQQAEAPLFPQPGPARVEGGPVVPPVPQRMGPAVMRGIPQQANLPGYHQEQERQLYARPAPHTLPAFKPPVPVTMGGSWNLHQGHPPFHRQMMPPPPLPPSLIPQRQQQQENTFDRNNFQYPWEADLQQQARPGPRPGPGPGPPERAFDWTRPGHNIDHDMDINMAMGAHNQYGAPIQIDDTYGAHFDPKIW